jgi:hypothetical protein
MYQLAYINRLSSPLEYIKHTTDGGATLSIPFDPDNTDAQTFAKWLKDGGTPEPAEEGDTVTSEWIAETITKLLPADEGTQ